MDSYHHCRVQRHWISLFKVEVVASPASEHASAIPAGDCRTFDEAHSGVLYIWPGP